MTDERVYRHCSLLVLAVIVCLVTGLIPGALRADDTTQSAPAVSDGHPSRPPQIAAEVGYFTGRRQAFRELYGGNTNFALSIQRPISKRFDLSLRAEYVRLDKNEPDLKYWTGSATPMLLYYLPRKAGFLPVLGAGVGLSHRRVIVTAVCTDENGIPTGGTTATQKSWNVCGIATVGLDLPVSERILLGIRSYFDYYPYGDPTVGKLGDTGGFRFVARLGFKI